MFQRFYACSQRTRGQQFQQKRLQKKTAEAAEKAAAAGVNGVTVSVPRTTVLSRMRLNRVSTEDAVASVRITALDVYNSLR